MSIPQTDRVAELREEDLQLRRRPILSISSTPATQSSPIGARQLTDELVTASLSCDHSDPAWDAFLQSSPLGQFQQSAMWAQAKQGEGWQPIRVVFTAADQMRGGFQILWRQSRLGRIGYVSKGPIVDPETPECASYVIDVLRTIVSRYRIRALILHPPDNSRVLPELLGRRPFEVNGLMKVNEATVFIDVRHGIAEAERRMSRSARNNVRQAVRKGVRVREGDERDIPTFFELMAATCERQGTRPNPPNVEALRGLWRAFSASGHARLTFAECEGQVVSGLLSLPFGRVVNLWKKGWSSAHGDRHPNELLTYEALEWAAANGYETCDFAALEKDIAIALLNGDRITSAQTQTRHFFNLRFGGEAKLLPEARVLVDNAVLRLAYTMTVSSPVARRLVERLGR